MNIRVTGTAAEVAQFQQFFNRGTNTLEPSHWPQWVQELDQALTYLQYTPEAHVGQGTPVQGIVTVTRL